MPLKKIFLLIGSLIISANLFAQNHQSWADSVLKFLETDEKKDYGFKIKDCDTLLTLFRNKSEDCQYIKTLTLKSYYKSYLGDFQEALSILNLAYLKYNQVSCNQTSLMPEIYLAYGSLYNLLNESRKANLYLQKGIDYFEKTYTNPEILIELYHSKANSFSNLDSQLFYDQLAYKIAVEKNNLKWQELILENMGINYAIAQNADMAKVYLHRALPLAIKLNSYINLSKIYNSLAGLYNEHYVIQRFLDSAVYYAKVKGGMEDMQAAIQNQAYFYSSIGEYQKAYDHLWLAGELKDSLYNQNKINAFADMEQKYESEKKQAQIVLLDEQSKSHSLQRNFFIVGMGLFVLLAGSIFMGLMKTSKEKKKSDILLLNILPEEVADELKVSGTAEAKQFDEVTVLFTDFKGFTAMAEKLTPKELVKDIHECFSEFDRIMEKHGMEKIKTIGDAYMAAGGLPTPNKTHAKDAIYAALEIIRFIETGKAIKMANGEPYFDIRIGIHTGPVVAGIVGVKKFAYDIWGDTVNTASRMESSGEAGKVNISGTTYEMVKDQFECIHRGKISAKGKGVIDMYFVERSVKL